MENQSPYGQTSLKDTLGILNEEESESELGPDEEYFGPLLQVIRSNTFEHAIEIANDTKYGLVSGVITKNKNLFWLTGIPDNNSTCNLKTESCSKDFWGARLQCSLLNL